MAEALPGGYTVGETVFFTGASHTFDDDNKLVHGQQGEVTGPATDEDGNKGVSVRFPGNKNSNNCYLAQVSRDAPPPLPGGYTVGEKVFFTGANYTYPDGDKLEHGQQGEVTGPMTFDGTGTRVRTKGVGVRVLYPGNKINMGCLLTEVTRSDPNYGLLQPLEAMSLDADALRTATAAAVAYCDAQGAGSVADLLECDLLDGLMASLAFKPVHAKKLSDALKKKHSESLKGPAAAAQANTVTIDSAARWTPEEMEKNLIALKGSTARDDELAYHFTNNKTAKLILSSGLRASTEGQLGGGVSVCKQPPHEMGWEQYGDGEWRATLGKQLWGEKWQEVLPGGPHADKLEMVVVVKVVRDIFINEKYTLPGRENVLIIPTSYLEERDGSHYYAQNKIVKIYDLRDTRS